MNEIESYGDAQVDIYILEIFNEIFTNHNSFFVDVGANDGITGSNSLLLEKHGWKGLLVEPNKVHQKQLAEIRTSPVEWCAISNSPSVTFNSVIGPDNLHGLSRIDSSEKFVGHVSDHGGKIESYEVPAMTLSDILEKNQVPHDLALLSVDVEGHELTVFKTLDFNYYQPKLIITEDNSKGRNSEVKDFLESKKYILVKRVGVNEFYVQEKDSKRFRLSKFKTDLKYKRWQSKYFLKRLLKIKDKNHYV